MKTFESNRPLPKSIENRISKTPILLKTLLKDTETSAAQPDCSSYIQLSNPGGKQPTCVRNLNCEEIPLTYSVPIPLGADTSEAAIVESKSEERLNMHIPATANSGSRPLPHQDSHDIDMYPVDMRLGKDTTEIKTVGPKMNDGLGTPTPAASSGDWTASRLGFHHRVGKFTIVKPELDVRPSSLIPPATHSGSWDQARPESHHADMSPECEAKDLRTKINSRDVSSDKDFLRQKRILAPIKASPEYNSSSHVHYYGTPSLDHSNQFSTFQPPPAHRNPFRTCEPVLAHRNQFRASKPLTPALSTQILAETNYGQYHLSDKDSREKRYVAFERLHSQHPHFVTESSLPSSPFPPTYSKPLPEKAHQHQDLSFPMLLKRAYDSSKSSFKHCSKPLPAKAYQHQHLPLAIPPKTSSDSLKSSFKHCPNKRNKDRSMAPTESLIQGTHENQRSMPFSPEEYGVVLRQLPSQTEASESSDNVNEIHRILTRDTPKPSAKQPQNQNAGVRPANLRKSTSTSRKSQPLLFPAGSPLGHFYYQDSLVPAWAEIPRTIGFPTNHGIHQDFYKAIPPVSIAQYPLPFFPNSTVYSGNFMPGELSSQDKRGYNGNLITNDWRGHNIFSTDRTFKTSEDKPIGLLTEPMDIGAASYTTVKTYSSSNNSGILLSKGSDSVPKNTPVTSPGTGSQGPKKNSLSQRSSSTPMGGMASPRSGHDSQFGTPNGSVSSSSTSTVLFPETSLPGPPSSNIDISTFSHIGSTIAYPFCELPEFSLGSLTQTSNFVKNNLHDEASSSISPVRNSRNSSPDFMNNQSPLPTSQYECLTDEE